MLIASQIDASLGAHWLPGERPQPDRAPDDDETPPHPAEPLKIGTPVIAGEDAWAVEAMEEFDQSIERQLPG